ncbi:MAG: CDP-2,3-bis-(O-geranylgeranyl)-sn-glycerol synthase [Candidatus Diapherotrites archaeon]|nr:CDP-2,3-bis-(O-geranylgeranyl)-sn-glycerol synthase [Candidatus Diapherotrites archaeon]
MLYLLISIAAYLVPIYVANACALIFGGGTPLDLNKKLYGKPIFGKGKTIRGTLAGIVFGLIVVFLLDSLMPKWFVADYLIFGVFLVFGAVFGDIAASFLKRRIGLESGAPVLFLDQLDFVFGSLILTLPIRMPNFAEVILIFSCTFLTHKATNYIAYKLKIKKVAW